MTISQYDQHLLLIIPLNHGSFGSCFIAASQCSLCCAPSRPLHFLELSKYVGTSSGATLRRRVTQENGKLVLQLVPAPNFIGDLEHWHYDTFRVQWRDSVRYAFPKGYVTFTLKANG